MRVQGQPYLRDDARPATSWDEALRHFESARTFWLATVREDGSPHLMPLLAVCVEGEMYFCAGTGTRKSRNLARDPRCMLSSATEGLDLVVEGRAIPVADAAVLDRTARAYKEKYGWDAEPRDGAFQGEGAPTAGPPPLTLYRLEAARAFGFGTDQSLNAMRWTFQ